MSVDNFKELGWREWLSLPGLGIERIKAKVDTGARTSALHAFFVEPYRENQEKWVRFGMHPNQGDTDTEVICKARVIDQRVVTDSGGHQEQRYIISTDITLGADTYNIEVTLTNRDSMKFRMLLGRTGIPKGVIVNPNRSYLLSKKKR